MNDYLKILMFSCLPIGVFVIICLHSKVRIKELEAEIERQSIELAHAHIPMQRDTIHDSIEVATQVVVEVVPDYVKDAMANYQSTIKALGLRVQQLESLQSTTIRTADTVKAIPTDDDNIFCYHDKWADISVSLHDSTIYYNIRDSLTTMVYREYKHRFLWWRWGTKGYRVKIINFNPNTSVSYNRYILVKD